MLKMELKPNINGSESDPGKDAACPRGETRQLQVKEDYL